MATQPQARRILCVGIDPILLESRCAVLRSSGYWADQAFPSEARAIMQEGAYDLIIISMAMSLEQKGFIIAGIPNTAKSLTIEQFTDPHDLLASVEQLLK